MHYWLMKSEPETFSIADLERVRVEPWTGVRSHFARAQMRKMAVGDSVLFYHSSAVPPGVAGLACVERTGVVDETQFDPDSPYYDAKATRDKPIWDCVDVRFVARLPHYVTLAQIRSEPALADMTLLKIGRLSVQPVTAREFARVVELGEGASTSLRTPQRVVRTPAKPELSTPAKRSIAKRRRSK